ncbi:CD209 antigen-like protein C isoform X3 [Larimichthys crocea]|uniref:CD209 antigen-like protein C isoform X3 n=1 Tax=Larimichthys crocea TaxID=215358 RepID=UPI000F5D7D1B|nr:CD209 antigen-like protein C isoform X3 [Larimichthys crocea]
MAEADVVEYSREMSLDRNVYGSQQQVASNGGSKVTLKRVAVAVLSTLLVATVIARFFTCYKYSQTMDKLQKLTDEYEAMKEILTDKRYLKCEEGWERNGTQCYYFLTNNLTWSDSRDECRQRGGDLVKIDSVEEQSFLQHRLKEKMIYPEDRHWIGLTDSKTEGTWLWTDGSPLNKSLTFWSKREPDNWKEENRYGEDCVRMGVKGRSDLKTWFDKSCTVPHKSICEKCVCCSST